MATKRRLIIAGVLTFLLGLIVMFPARVLLHWVSPPGVAIAGISGTIWSGAASEVNAHGLYVTNLRWRIKAHRLFTLKLVYELEASAAGGFVETDLSTGFGNEFEFSELTAAVPLQAVGQIFGKPGLAGNANAQFERLTVSDGLPVAADGSLEIRNLVAPDVAADSIGGYLAEFFTGEDGVIASVEDTDGVLDLAGRLQFSHDRGYQFLGQIAAKPTTPPELLERMQRLLGSANERGQYELRLEGQL